MAYDYINFIILQGYRDNPKINAIAVVKGVMDGLYICLYFNIEELLYSQNIYVNAFLDVPQLGPIPPDPEDYHGMQEEEEETTVRSRHTSGPRTPDPYSIDDSSVMLPVFIAIGAFIPLLFCLCKL